LPFCHLTLKTAIPAISPYERKRNGYPDVLRTLGDHLRKRRLDLGMTQKQVARAMGASQSAVHGWEENWYPPTRKNVRRIVAFLGYDPFHSGWRMTRQF
jgi:DNA-binding XRE family transcriptional regulator